MHLAHSLFHNTFDRASPTGMENTHSALFGVDENNGQAVSGLNAEEQTRSIRYESIAGELRFWRCVDEVDDIGMNLAQSNERCDAGSVSPLTVSCEFVQKRRPVALDRGFRVVFGKAEIERVAPVYARESSHARREPLDEPAEFA
jgi:hypothetical protein